MKSNRKSFEKRGYFRKSDEPLPEAGLGRDRRSIWKKPSKKSNGFQMVVQSSSGVLEHYTYCGRCKKWRSRTDTPHTAGGHDLFC